MRFLALMYPGEQAESGALPDEQAIAQMMKFNEMLASKGALISLDGLHPSAKGARITFPDGKPVVTDGPFAESKELVGGFWMIKADSREQAVEWFKQCPAMGAERIELRQVYEFEEFNIDRDSAVRQQVDRVEAALGQANRA